MLRGLAIQEHFEGHRPEKDWYSEFGLASNVKGFRKVLDLRGVTYITEMFFLRFLFPVRKKAANYN